MTNLGLSFGALALASVTLVVGCGGDKSSTGGGDGGSSDGGEGGQGGMSSTHAGGNGGGGDASGGGGSMPTTGPMTLISRGVPSFASSTDPASMTSNANDDNPASAWSSTELPAWLAYDLSETPEADRQKALVAFYCFEALDYIVTMPSAEMALPLDYTIETNSAKGGGMPPTEGWKTLVTVTDNARSSRHDLVDLGGASWIRMNVSKSTDPAKALVDLDVYSAPSGATNDWLFMGDSITFITMPRAFSDLPSLVEKAKAGDYPAIIDAAIGGTTTVTAEDAIVETMKGFPGKYVVLAYGTNDHSDDFHMESLVKSVIAAGKTPVVPHMPWADGADTQMKVRLSTESSTTFIRSTRRSSLDPISGRFF